MFSKGVKHMLLAGLFFSLMNVGVKFLENIPAIEIVFFRSMVTLCISVVMIYRLGLPFLGNNKPILILRGVFGLGALSLFFLSIQKLPFATAVTLQQLAPIFSSIFALFLLKERLRLPQWLFFAISFAGVVLMKGFNNDIPHLYFWVGVLSAVFSGLAYNMVRKLKDSDHPLVVVMYFPLVALPIAGVFSYFTWVQPQGWEWLILLGVGIATQIAQVNLTKALQLEELGKVSIVSYLSIVYALFIGAIFFEDHYNVLTILGIFLVVLGVLLNLWFTKEKKTSA
jgi:drug/metabolite transporter (DMT)-like permease